MVYQSVLEIHFRFYYSLKSKLKMLASLLIAIRKLTIRWTLRIRGKPWTHEDELGEVKTAVPYRGVYHVTYVYVHYVLVTVTQLHLIK